MPTVNALDIADKVLEDFGLQAPLESSLTPNSATLNQTLNSIEGGRLEETLNVVAELMVHSARPNHKLAAARTLLEIRKILGRKDSEEGGAPVINIVVKDGNVNVQNVLCPQRPAIE